MKIKSNIIDKIDAFEHTKISDEINKIITIKLKCENLINKGLFSEVYHC